jgi:hypothetical protein
MDLTGLEAIELSKINEFTNPHRQIIMSYDLSATISKWFMLEAQ